MCRDKGLVNVDLTARKPLAVNIAIRPSLPMQWAREAASNGIRSFAVGKHDYKPVAADKIGRLDGAGPWDPSKVVAPSPPLPAHAPLKCKKVDIN